MMVKYLMLCMLVSLSVVPSMARDDGMRQFQDIAARLDVGGDLFLVIHTGRWLDAVLSRLEGDAETPPTSADERDLQDMSGRMRRFFARQGISGLQGIGISSVPVQGGMSSLKVFMLRDAQDANLPFWRGLFGWQPRRLLSLDLLPSDTDFVWASTPDLHGLWQLLELARDDLELDQLDHLLGQVSDASRTFLQTEPVPLLESLRDEVLVATRTGGQDASSALSWEWLIVIGTGEPVLHRGLKEGVAQKGGALEEVRVGGHTMQRVRAAADNTEEAPVLFAFANIPGFVVVGNSHRMVEDALRAQRHRSGLLARPAFIDAFRGQNMVNNGLFYVSKRGAGALRDAQDARVQESFGEQLDPFGQLLLEELAGDTMRGAVLALTLANWRQGIMISGRSGIGGTAMGSWLGSFPARWWLQVTEWMHDVLTVQLAD